MTLPSRHRIQNSSTGGLRRARYLSVTVAPHTTEYLWVSGEEAFVKPECQSEGRTLIFQAGRFIFTTPGPPPSLVRARIAYGRFNYHQHDQASQETKIRGRNTSNLTQPQKWLQWQKNGPDFPHIKSVWDQNCIYALDLSQHQRWMTLVIWRITTCSRLCSNCSHGELQITVLMVIPWFLGHETHDYPRTLVITKKWFCKFY